MKRIAAFVFAGMVLATLPAVSFAAPAAGTVIGNQATATYNDAGGNARTATSNLVQTTVTQVKSFTLAANGARTAAPGQTIYYPHTITNTGNGTDTYTLNAPASTSFGAGPHGSLAYYIDANGDGQPDNATPIATSGAIPAGGTFRFVVAGTVPAGAVSGNTATITVSVSDTAPTTATNTDTTTVAASVINVTKSFSVTSGTSPSGPITVTLSYINTGTSVATNVQFTDALPATLTYVAGSGRWSVSGGAPLTDPNDGVEQSASFPPGIDYRSSLGAGATVIAIIPSVAAGASGNVAFQVNVNANLAPQTLSNTAQYQTSSQLSTNTNTAGFQVLQGAGVVANGSNNNSANGVGEPVVIASAPAGATITFNDYVWNRGNGSDTFDITLPANTFPPGTSATLMQQDGATPLINSGGGPAPDTGPIPGLGQACPAPFVTDTTITPNACGYRVVVKVVLPANAPAGSYSITLHATSAFNNAMSDDVVDTLGAVSANTADVTNDRAAPPAGTAIATDGLGASGATIERTNTVTPGAVAIPTRFRVWVTNTGLVSYDFNLTAVFAATSVAGVTPPALPAGWSVVFKADASGAPADCSSVGAAITATGALAPGAGRLACAEVTVPTLASGTAAAGNYDFDFTATSSTNSTVTDSIRDRVTVAFLRNMTFTGSAALQTFASGSVVYTHTLTNLGNAADTANFSGGCLSDSRALQGWTSTAYVDANANGTLEVGTDTPVVCGTSSVTLQPGEARAVFIRVTAPAGALPSDPADVTSLTATYAAALTVTDSTTVIAGLAVTKEQQAVGAAGCSNNNAPAGSYSAAAIPASATTAAGSCIAYRVTITNTTVAPMTGVSLSDLVPANTRMHYACSGNGSAAPSVTLGSIAGTTPADNAAGTVGATIGNLAASQSAVVYFCVQVNAATPVGTSVSNQASGAGTQAGNTSTAASNTVAMSVGAAVGSTFAGTLAPSTHTFVNPAQVVTIKHVLTNTGTATDSFSLAATELPGGFTFAAFAILPDVNNDGIPDSAVPVVNPIVLNPGQAYHFVLRAVVPTGAIVGQDTMRISATSTGGATIIPVNDVMEAFPTTPPDCATAAKFLSRDKGPSPSDALTVTINYFPCDKARAKLLLSDTLPAGMHYVAGSGRWSGTGSAALTDAVSGDDRQGAAPHQVAYDFGQSTANTVFATIYGIAAQANGSLTFQVTIDPGFSRGSVITNTASYRYFDANGLAGYEQFASAAYTVTGKADLTLVGQHVPTSTPGTTVTFTNVLTNTGEATDTFDVTLGASTFPAGTQVRLYKSDGTSPLADTDGDGTPDTGPLAPGASYNIVVKVDLPATTLPGTYKVSKTARSAIVPSRTVSVDDVVDGVALACKVSLDPDNQALIGFGQHVTYTHYLTNRGNCSETVEAMLNYLGDSKAGWTSFAYIDNPAAGGSSIPGVVDATDTRVVQGWTRALGPGESVRVLVDVFAPSAAAANGAKALKQLADSDVTTLVITGVTVGPLVVHDTTLVDTENIPGEPSNAIRNFTDGSFTTPTPWGVIGRNLFLRADAAACNADPAVAESRSVLITGANGESEQATAIETGPNTGIFVVAPLPIHAPPVVPGDGILEGNPNDVFQVDLQGCGQTIATVVTLMNAASVVFDSRSNDPIANATVRLVAATGGTCGTTPVALGASQSNPATTGADGRFAFNAPAGDYCLAVVAPNGWSFPSKVPYTQLPPGRNLNVTGLASGGSYGNPFHVGADGAVVVDVPLDIAAQSGLFVQKDASKATAEVGDFVDYTVTVRNSTGNALGRADVTLTDNFPAGFAYVAGSARRDGTPLAEPVKGAGSSITFTLGHLDAGALATITYRARIAPAALKGDGTNRAQAFYTVAGITTASNIAAVKVQVTGGVFSDNGFILGKIYLDCNANGLQDKGEEGVPGVRILLEDGTYAITDGEGKFSFYGIAPVTHVVKADRVTLPVGASLEVLSARNLGDPNSRIVDLKNGEMARADFAIAGCDEAVRGDVAGRRAAVARSDELAGLAGAQLTTEPRVLTDVKALPASGVVERMPAATMPGAAPTTGPGVSAPYLSLAPAGRIGDTLPTPAPAISHPSEAPPPAEPLEKLVEGFADNTLAFVGMEDGQTLAFAQTNVRVKGMAGTTFKLVVNNEPVANKAVGKRSVLAEKEVQAWEFVGVDLRSGDNTLTAVQIDSFGNERGAVTIHLKAPGHLAKIAIDVPAAGAIADGKTPVKVVVRITDEHGVPVTVRTPVTLESARGRWIAEDLDVKQPGLQQFIENGRGEFELVPTLEPGENMVYVSSGALKAQARLDFLPEMRQMVATGVIEGIINAHNINTRALQPATASDAFEQELRHLSREWNAGRTDGGVRAAFYLKGKIKGDYLLTAAYDSDKDTQERLFRDIQPDEFYPVYGDSAVRGFDAQSTSKLYVRVDKGRSYLLWGDFSTSAASETRKLTNYTRSLTGLKEHYENSRLSVNAFASRDTTRQVIEEQRANGTSGPFQLSNANSLVNSETIEVITRDRNQPAMIISTVPLTRFSDYEIEALTGRILFKAPIASVDKNLNPNFIRITYEVDQGGPEFWVAGVDAQVKVSDRIEVGGIFVKDKNPLQPFTLGGANMVVKLGAATYIISEVARSKSGIDDITGNAGRIEIKHESKDLKANVYVAHTDLGFENPGSYLIEGRSEAGGKVDYKISERMTLHGEALRTQDVQSGSRRDGATAGLQIKLAEHLTLEVGMRHSAEKGDVSPIPALPGQPAPAPMPDEVTTARARITGDIPGVKKATAYGEAEIDVQDASRKILAVGGEYPLFDKGRLYARHEFISSITGPYGLNPNERQNTTAIGVDTEYMKDGRFYSEYRIADAISGGDTEAALGLKNLWSIAPGLKLGTTFERVHTLAGTGLDENTALALALEYTANPDWKGSTRLEVRDGSSQDSLLFTVGMAARINRDWTALARNAYTLTRNKTGDGEHLIDRMQAGLAWRDNDTNKWNVLARVESRVEHDDTAPPVLLRNSTQIVSVNADWQLNRPFLVTGRYAAKWSTDNSNDLTSRYHAQVVGARATWEFAPKWDMGLVTSATFGGPGTTSRQYGVGLEFGYNVATNLWVSAGYNFFGYKDDDLAGNDYTVKGPYVRLRYKFDEGVFGQFAKAPAAASTTVPAGASATAPVVTSESRDDGKPSTPAAPAGGFVPLAPSAPSGGAPGSGEAGPL